MQPTVQSIPLSETMMVFLMAYSLAIAFVFRRSKPARRRRRRWLVQDYVWMPLGGMTGVLLLSLWWRLD